jgi:PAS domain S-box-containing protein
MAENQDYPEMVKRIQDLEKKVEEQRRTIDQMRIKQEALELLFHAQPDSSFLLDHEGKILAINKTAAQSLGQHHEDMIGTHIVNYIPPDVINNIRKRYIELLSTGKPIHFQFEREGRIYEDHVYPVHDDDKNIVATASYVRDITETIHTQKALKQAYNIIKRSPMVAFLWQDMERMPVKYVSENVEKLIGYKAEEFTSGRVLFADLVHPDDQRRVVNEINRHKNDKHGNEFSHEPYRIIDKNGVVKWIENITFIQRDNEGHISHFQGIITDITNRMKLQEERKSIELRLQQAEKMEAIGMLAGGVAHDLNNILSAIVSYPELILMQIPEDSPMIKPILSIKKAGERAATVVQDLLTLARRGVAITEVVNLNHIISEQLRSPEIDNLKFFHPDIEVETRFAEDLLNVKGSSAHLSKTIMNLITNAAEAMPAGGKIFISTENRYVDIPIKGYDHVLEGDYILVTVSDTGIGISNEDMKNIFEPFYTRKAMGRSGTGLGMAVVWGTVKDHKGYIHIESRENEGTTFKLYFPITREEILKDKDRLPREEYLGQGESILIVDDVEEQREIASIILTKLGYSVCTASGGEQAIEYLKNNNADLLVLDMIMEPGMDGLDTYKKILELKPKQKAIIVSGYSETDRVKEVQRLGGGQYIKKPYTLEKMGLAVREELI